MLTRNQIAKMFAVTAQTVRLWEKKHLITPCCHINGRPRYNQEDVNQLMNKKRA
ncbi:MAG: MerR family transcriptional regulator [Sphingobacteriales bacterium]|nr:MAG: MerR family transcriptional regulator [Sphingobacteriales bacterium]